MEESDHMALLVRLENLGNKANRRLQRGFAFEEMWTKHENYEDMIASAWENSGMEAQGINGLWTKLHNMSAEMKRWSFETFSSVRAELKSLRGKLEVARVQEIVSGSSLEVREIEKKLHDLYEREEIMYHQRSRQEWLKAGDRNTRYFQNRASHRKRKNMVRSLKRSDGTVWNTNEGMLDMALAFYQTLYTSEGSSNSDRVLNLIETFVTDDMIRALTGGVLG
jgi:hypothetical protein